LVCGEPGFRPYVYALDLVLPGALLGQAESWAPAQEPIKLVNLLPDVPWLQANFPLWLQSASLPDTFAMNCSVVVKLLGWLVSGTYLAGLAGLFGRNKE
jgi:hypothetical protein